LSSPSFALKYQRKLTFSIKESALESRQIGTWATRTPSCIPTTMPYQKFQLPLTTLPDPAFRSSSAAAAYRSSTSGYRPSAAPGGVLESDLSGLMPGTTRSIGTVRFTAVPTGPNRPRGESGGADLAPPVLVLRDSERPDSWVMPNPV
jgi:hypothetical protein